MIRISAGKCIAALLFAGAASQLNAQAYPQGQITLVIPLAAGDASDTAGRTIADGLGRELRVPIVPVNRPGAGGALGTDVVVKAPKDGYTISLSNNASLVFRAIMDPAVATYDPLRDLTPLALAMRSPSVLVVSADRPYRNFAEMMKYAKANPGKIRIGTAGLGSVGHFCVNTLSTLWGAELTMVPFKGAMPAVTAARGGHIDGVVLALGTMTGHIRSGAMRAIVISSKSEDFADIPTLAELGYAEQLFDVWTGFFAPAGVPPEVTRVLVPALERAIRAPDVSAKLRPLGILPAYAPPEKLVEEIRSEHRRVSEIARKAGLAK